MSETQVTPLVTVKCTPYFVLDDSVKILSDFGPNTQEFITKRIEGDYNSLIEDIFHGFDINSQTFEGGILTLGLTPNEIGAKRYNISNNVDGAFEYLSRNFPKKIGTTITEGYDWNDLDLKFFKGYALRLALNSISA